MDQAPALRRATPVDAPALAELHVACWREAYAGLLPQAMLAEISVARRTFMWARILSRPERHNAARVHLAHAGDDLIGFGACGTQRTPALLDAGFDGEITALYVRARSQRRGLGAVLSRALAADLRAHGCRGMALWVLRNNLPARRFYEALGGILVGEAEDRREHATLVEVAYGWPRLDRLPDRSVG